MYATSRRCCGLSWFTFRAAQKSRWKVTSKKFELLGRSDTSTEETPELKRNNSYPPFDFVVLPITADLTTVLINPIQRFSDKTAH